MHKSFRRDVVFGLGLVSLASLWLIFPFNDLYAPVDDMVLLGSVLVTIAALLYRLRNPDTIGWRDVAHWPMAVAGLALLAGVAIRQWWQFAQVDAAIIVIDEGADITTTLMRYGTIQVVTWVLGWCYVIVAVWPTVHLASWYSAHKHEIWGLSAIVIVASILRWYQLGDIPNIINGDEGLIGMWAVQLLTQYGTLGHVFVNMDGVGTNYLLFMKGIINVFGRTEFAVRLIPAIFGVLAVITNYLFARSLFGVRIGMLTAIMLATAHVAVHFSRTVAVSYTYATALVPLLLWCMWMLTQTRHTWPTVIAALALSLHVNLYVDAWAWSVLVIIIIGAWAIVDIRALQPLLMQIAQMLGLMVLGIMPMLIWGIYFPGDFFARLSTDGSFVSGWLMRETEIRNTSAVWIIVELYQYAFSTFLTTPFEDFYHAGVPILDRVSAVFFLIGLVIIHNRLHTWRMLLVLGWFWGGMTALAVFTIPVSTYPYRLLVVVPVVILIAAIAIDWIVDWMRMPRVSYFSIGVLVVIIAFLNIDIYWWKFVSACKYGGDIKTEQAGTLARYLVDNAPDGTTVVVHGSAPDGFYIGPWRSLEFLNPTITFINIEERTDTGIDVGGDVWYVAIPERYNELEQYAVQYPQAEPIIPIQQCEQPLLYAVKIPQP